jgi:hypothetical protein
MNDRVIISIEKLKELCPKCAEKVTKGTLAKGLKLTQVSISKSDYAWLMMKQDERPPKAWFDNCVSAVSQKEGVDDPEALCGWIWYHGGGQDEEAAIPDTEDAIEAVRAKMHADECFGKLKKDIETVLCWRKFGKTLNPEQQAFANRVADEMIGFRVAKQVGIQLVSGDNIRFIKKGMQPTQESNAVAGITQDAVANGPAKDGKFPRKTKEQVNLDKVDKPKGDKQPALKESAPESGNLPKKTPDIKSIKVVSPIKEGEVTDTCADEKIGHHPELPMPKKTAEELIANAEWGVEIGAYTNVKEGVDRQLGRKEYQEFIDTDEKLKSVLAYLKEITKE